MLDYSNRIHIVCGDPVKRGLARQDIENLVRQKQPDLSKVLLDSPDPEDLSRLLFSSSLFGGFRLIFVTNLDMNKAMSGVFERLSKTRFEEEFWRMIIEESDIRTGKSIASKLKECKAELVSCSRCSKPTEGTAFVLSTAHEHGLSFSDSGARRLVDLCGLDYMLIRGEMEKLSLLTDGRILGASDVASIVQPMGDAADFLQLYLAILKPDMDGAVSHARSVISRIGPESVFTCIMKIVEAAIIVSCVSKTKAQAFTSKKRNKVQKNAFNGFLWAGPSKVDNSKPPSTFLYRVAEQVAKRIGSKKRTLSLYSKCYDNYVRFRLASNLSLASAQIDELLCVMCRG